MLPGFLGQSSSQIVKKTVEMCAVHEYKHESTFQLVSGKNGFWVLSPKDQRDHPDFHQWQMQKLTSVMVWGCSRANGMGDWDMCEGTIDMEAYTGIEQRHILPSRWFRGDRVYVLDWRTIGNVWPVMKRRTRQRRPQTAELLKSCIKRDWTSLLLAKL